jgi:hypothetical protein
MSSDGVTAIHASRPAGFAPPLSSPVACQRLFRLEVEQHAVKGLLERIVVFPVAEVADVG